MCIRDSLFSGVLCVGLGAAAAILWGLDQPRGVVGPVLALAGVPLSACVVHTALVRRWAHRVMQPLAIWAVSVSYTHLRAHEIVLELVCRLLLEKKKLLSN